MYKPIKEELEDRIKLALQKAYPYITQQNLEKVKVNPIFNQNGDYCWNVMNFIKNLS